jgi:hypothetical protein
MCESDYISLGYYELMLFSHHDVRSLPTRQGPIKFRDTASHSWMGARQINFKKYLQQNDPT